MNNKELITSHKISLLVLIRMFGETKLRHLMMKEKNVIPENFTDEVLLDVQYISTPKYRKNYCMMMLNLIQGPDMSLTDLRVFLRDRNHLLFPDFQTTFMNSLKKILGLNIEGILELVGKCNALMNEPSAVQPIITKTSVLGLFIRRTVVMFEKLSCSAVVQVFKSFEFYFNSSPIEENNLPATHQVAKNSGDQKLTWRIDDVHKSHTALMAGRDSEAWTRRQAELFMAQQASTLMKNEADALEPGELHRRIQELLYAAPDCTEAYFLSYLNFMRVRDFCGALHSLYHCFDRGAGYHLDSKQGIVLAGSAEDKARSFRYGALNLAMFYTTFGHKEEAMLALKECVMLAHGSSCNFCLQHALCWLYRMDDASKTVLMKRSVARGMELNLNYLASLGIQALAQYSAFTKEPPAKIFEMTTRSDIYICQHSIPELAANSYSLKSTLWSLYGRPAMAGLYAQLLLHSVYQDSNSEATCLAICQLAAQLMAEGEPCLCASLVWFARDRFPQLKTRKIWALCDQVLSFDHTMKQGHWQQARRAAEELAATDKWESLLRLAELQLKQGEPQGALDRVTELLKFTNSNNEVSPNLHVRALMLQAHILGTFNTHGARIYVAALAEAETRYLTNLCTIITLKIAEHQLAIGLPAQAMSLIGKVILSALSHGSTYEQGEAMLLQVKCKIAMADKSNKKEFEKSLPSFIETLNKTKNKFAKSEAVSKVREVMLLQVLLYHTCEHYVSQKYKLGHDLRRLDEQIASKTTSHV